MMEQVSSNGEILAIIIYADYRSEGTHFLTQPDAALQVAYMKHSAGHSVEPHEHKLQRRQIEGTQEVIIVRSGEVNFFIFDSDRRLKACRTLKAGDVIVLVAGGHSLQWKTQADLIEVKTGPYLSVEEDKERWQ